MDEAVQDLVKHYNAFEAEFRSFFPELEAHISHFREDLIN